jgi:DNA-binding CsgD family transcriptional regulator
VGELLERDRELAVLTDAFHGSQSGNGRCIVVDGPAGIGKTTLLSAARALAARDGFRVLSGSGGVLEADFAYGVIRQLFSPTLASAANAGELLSGAAALARPVLALGADVAKADARQASVLEAMHGLFWLTARIAAEAPLLLVVDDAHWCDGASLRFLVYLRRRLEGLPVLLVVAARPGEPGGEEHLLDLLAADASVEVVRPAPLSEETVAEMLRAGLATEPHPSFTAAAHEATEGNPFLLGELVSALVAGQIRPTQEAAAVVSTIGPEGVQRAILRRLADLGTGAPELARAVAVLGGIAELRHAAELAGLDDVTAPKIAEALVRVQILRDERALSFVHPLVRAAVYADMPVTSRAHAHAEAARILTAAGADEDSVAAHYLASEPASDPEVVEHLRVAARQASEHGAMDVAATYLRRALAEPPTEHQRTDLLRDLGAAELAAGQPDAAAERLEAAGVEAEDLASRVGIVLMRRHALVLADRIGEAVAVVDEVRQDCGATGPMDLLDAAAIGAAQLDFTVVRAVQGRIADLRDRAADPRLREPLGLAVAALATALANGPLQETIGLTERAVSALPDLHPDSAYSFEGQLAIALCLAERFDRLMLLSEGWLSDARRAGSLPRFISMATVRSSGAYRMGAVADAEAVARDAVEAARLFGHHFWLPGAVAAVVNPLVEQGRFDEAEALLVDTRVEERHGASHSYCWAAMFLPSRGHLRIAQGRLREGLADLLTCGEQHETPMNRSPSLWAWRSEAALAHSALGEADRAAELADAELYLARQLGAPRCLGVALRAAGLVTGGDAGRVLLEKSCDVLAGSEAVLEHARALNDYGSSLRRGGFRAEARAPLREALELASRCGADLLVERARGELLASGARPRSERLTGPDALTPSERRVARMAAAGQGNREIAQTLFLTRRTVETHLTHAYQKLGIGARENLAAALGPTP